MSESEHFLPQPAIFHKSIFRGAEEMGAEWTGFKSQQEGTASRPQEGLDPIGDLPKRLGCQ